MAWLAMSLEERYELRGRIGSGGVGAVYRAYDHRLGREVAIKRVLAGEGETEEQEAIDSLVKETAALTAVQHPNIVSIYDAGTDEDGPYVVMELLTGRTLEEMVERGSLVWEDFRELTLQTLEALIAAHDLQLLHRDLKPGNVMVHWLPSGKFQAKLVDFGLAKFSARPSRQTINQNDAVLGSIHFMAPEQFERTELDVRTDIYSLGCVYYFALTGLYPFRGETAPLVMAAHLQHHVKPLQELRPDIPAWAADWVMWMISRHSRDRPEDARAAHRSFVAETVPDLASPTAGDQTSEVQDLLTTWSPPKESRVKLLTGEVTARQDLRMKSGEKRRVRLVTGPVHQEAHDIIRSVTGPVQIHSQRVDLDIEDEEDEEKPSQKSPIPLSSGMKKPQSTQKPPTPPKNRAVLWVVGVGLLVVLLLLGVLYKRALDQREVREQLAALAGEVQEHEGDGLIPTKEAEVDLMLENLSKPDKLNGREFLYERLVRAQTGDVDELNAQIAESALDPDQLPETAAQLITVLRMREASSETPKLLAWLREKAPDGAAKKAALAHVKELAGESQLEALLEMLQDEDQDVRKMAESAVQRLMAASDDPARLSRQLSSSFEKASDLKQKQSYLRLLISTGSDEAREQLEDIIEGDNQALQIAALSALQNWPEQEGQDSAGEVTSLLLTQFDQNEGPVRQTALDTALAHLRKERQAGDDSTREAWEDLLSKTYHTSETLTIIQSLANHPADWALDLMQGLTENEDQKIANRARAALRHMEKKREEAEKERDG